MRLVVFGDAIARAVKHIGGVIERAAFLRQHAAGDDVHAALSREFSNLRLRARAVHIRHAWIDLLWRKACVPEFG